MSKQNAPAAVEALESQVETLKMELAQKNMLLKQGFQVFTETAEKLQQTHKVLQQQVSELEQEVAQKNKALEHSLGEMGQVKTYLSNIFESQEVGVIVTDLSGSVTSVNRSGQELLGVDAPSLVGEKINPVLGVDAIPQDPEKTKYHPLPEGEPLSYNRGDGETLRLQVSVTRMTGEEGEALGFILNVSDVTLLKELEEHAERRNRFTAMGEMAANIAHEIRNPLGSIELFSSLIKKALDETDEKAVMINHITNGIASMNHIISNVLEYTKPKPAELLGQDLHMVLREHVAFTGFIAEQNHVEVKTEFNAQKSRILGDSEHLKQVFHNLFVNAMQAMPEGGTLTLSTRLRTLSNPKLLARLGGGDSEGKKKREVLEVAFKDTGAGMPAIILKQIYDPFFTTKSRGTGLGLAIVHNIMESHQGVIDLESTPEKGTHFLLMFPLLDA